VFVSWKTFLVVVTLGEGYQEQLGISWEGAFDECKGDVQRLSQLIPNWFLDASATVMNRAVSLEHVCYGQDKDSRPLPQERAIYAFSAIQTPSMGLSSGSLANSCGI
jgi:hypothetical protein